MDHHGIEVSTPASYLGSPRFKCQPIDRLYWDFLRFLCTSRL